MKNLHKILSNEPTKKGDIAVGITLKIWDGEGDAPQHSYNLFITNDEEISNEYWVTNGREVFKPSDCPNISLDFAKRFWRKVILTTDRLLIADGVQPIPNDFLEWFVNNPKCEEVEIKMCVTDPLKVTRSVLQPNLWQYKIVMSKAETIEEAAENYAVQYLIEDEQEIDSVNRKQSFIAGAKWQAEQFKNTKR